jgi:hypothetical protein
MNLIERYGPCKGMKLLRFGRFTLHIWIIPAGYTIPEHSHNNEHIELCLLKGHKTTLYRKATPDATLESATVSFPRDFGRVFSIPPGYSHGFTVSKHKLIFLNFARWKAGVKPTSAAVDFQLTNT